MTERRTLESEPDRISAKGEAGPPSLGPFASYVLEKRLAVGGMSEVFLARRRDDAGSPAHVVLKRILPDLVEDDAVRSTFELEARVHRLVHHPSVVSFIEFGTYAGDPFIVMEHVDGCDLGRVLRRARAEDRPMSVGTMVYVTRRLCEGLATVHEVADDQGKPLGVVHRDVTPSNILLSKRGEVKLGDFGIAHLSRAALDRTSLALRGKYAYLAPEQVSQEPFDHRADLFSLAVVLAESIINGPLFPGAGQLAVLLAIRDARIDALRAIKNKLPLRLYDVLCKALSRRPDDRFSSAYELSDALRPFQGNPREAIADLASWVAYTSDHASAARDLRGAVLDVLAAGSGASAVQARAASTLDDIATLDDSIPPEKPIAEGPPTSPKPEEPATVRPTGLEPPSVGPASIEEARASHPDEVRCFVRAKGREPRQVHLAKLIEMLATGQVTARDEVDFGDGFHLVSSVAMLARYLPAITQTTRRLDGPGVPDFVGTVPETTIGDALGWIVRHLESGVLFAQPRLPGDAHAELYFKHGKLVLAVSNEPAMLLGERLVKKGLIQRGELELAVLVMHRYNGQLGDTLVGLGLADPVEVFQAIRAQGRDRVAELFKWNQGQLAFYRGIDPARVDFRLDLDVPGLILAGLTEVRSTEGVFSTWDDELDRKLPVTSPRPAWTKEVTWPSVMLGVLRELAQGATVRETIGALGPTSTRGKSSFEKAQVLLAIEALASLGLVSTAGLDAAPATRRNS